MATRASTNQRLVVRALAAGDRLEELTPVWGEPASTWTATPPTALAVLRGERLVGVAGSWRTGTGICIDELQVLGDQATEELLRAIADAHPGQRIELLARDARPAVDELARAAGLSLAHRNVIVRGSLAQVRAPSPRRLTFRRYEELGRRGTAAVLRAIWSGRRGPTGLSPERELERFLGLARTDTSLWRIAYHEGRPTGAALCLGVSERTGTCQYLGLLPRMRGLGLGAALHGEALWLMRSVGLDSYEDATTEDNVPMQRIFARAGCEPVGTAALFIAPERHAGSDRAGGGRRPGASVTHRIPRGDHVSLLRKVPCRRS